MPRVAEPSIWHSIIPKFLRQSKSSSITPKPTKRKDWNPATFYIVIFLLIGSNAIQMISLRNDFTAFSRRADARIGLLKELIQRVQDGEDVDVERLLGTGNPDKEKEWVDILRDIEDEDRLWKTKEDKAAQKLSRAEEGSQSETAAKGSGQNNTTESERTSSSRSKAEVPPRFY